MAIVRCVAHGVKSPGTGHWKHNYVRSIAPAGGAATAAICGNPKCENPGLIWLDSSESTAYQGGRRIFGLILNRAKVRAAE